MDLRTVCSPGKKNEFVCLYARVCVCVCVCLPPPRWVRHPSQQSFHDPWFGGPPGSKNVHTETSIHKRGITYTQVLFSVGKVTGRSKIKLGRRTQTPSTHHPQPTSVRSDRHCCQALVHLIKSQESRSGWIVGAIGSRDTLHQCKYMHKQMHRHELIPPFCSIIPVSGRPCSTAFSALREYELEGHHPSSPTGEGPRAKDLACQSSVTLLHPGFPIQ